MAVFMAYIYSRRPYNDNIACFQMEPQAAGEWFPSFGHFMVPFYGLYTLR